MAPFTIASVLRGDAIVYDIIHNVNNVLIETVDTFEEAEALVAALRD